MKKKPIYLYSFLIVSILGNFLGLWDLLTGKQVENPAQLLQLQGNVAQEYDQFYDAAFVLNHNPVQIAIHIVGFLILVATFVFLIKKNLFFANVFYIGYSLFTIVVLAYNYLLSQPLYHYFSEPTFRESAQLIPKVLTFAGVGLNAIFLAVVVFKIFRQQKDLNTEDTTI